MAKIWIVEDDPKIGLLIEPKAVAMGELPRSEKKSTRLYDNRY